MTANNRTPRQHQQIVIPDQTKPAFRVELRNDANFAEVYLYGVFHTVENYPSFLDALDEATKSVSVARVWVTSPGGSLDTMLEIATRLKRFRKLITVSVGGASSAGALIWSLGDVRAVHPSTSIMYHRESYGVPFAKTNQHEELAVHRNQVGTELLADWTKEILSPEEIEKAKFTEVWKTGRSMIDAGVAISVEEMERREAGAHLSSLGEILYNEDTMEYVVVTNDQVRPIKSFLDQTNPFTPIDMIDYLFGKPLTPGETVAEEAVEQAPKAYTPIEEEIGVGDSVKYIGRGVSNGYTFIVEKYSERIGKYLIRNKVRSFWTKRENIKLQTSKKKAK